MTQNWETIHQWFHTHTHTHIHMYVYMGSVLVDLLYPNVASPSNLVHLASDSLGKRESKHFLICLLLSLLLFTDLQSLAIEYKGLVHKQTIMVGTPYTSLVH